MPDDDVREMEADVWEIVARLDAMWREERDEKQYRLDVDYELSDIAQLCLDASSALERLMAELAALGVRQ